MSDERNKISAAHLSRKAYLYIRQSTIRQVFENQESTRRQYDLQKRATGLGWAEEDVIVLDDDLGVSGAAGVDRVGFQKLVAEVGMGNVGLVMGLEVSRLARGCGDWHRLLEICALTNTLILDEEGLYDPTQFNDRLLLGLKGTISEAELHVIRSRLQGGILNRATRGELKTRLPVGFVYDPNDKVVLDPDQQVRDTIRWLFKTFRLAGSGTETVRRFHAENILFPTRLHSGTNKGSLCWRPMTVTRLYAVLRNPRYAGAFVYGRRHYRKLPNGGTACDFLTSENWHSLIPDAHEGYITWKEYEGNLRKLEANALYHPEPGAPPREGPALLQGIVVCGICGRRMTTRYHAGTNGLRVLYVCQGSEAQFAAPSCQSLPGGTVDEKIGELLLDIVSPVALEKALDVQKELEAKTVEVDAIHQRQIDRATYEADLARRRYMNVDPENRLVAVSLENEWNQKLKALAKVEDEYKRRQHENHRMLDRKAKEKIRRLSEDFPKVWNAPETPMRERKRLLRLVIEDVTLTRDENDIIVQIRYRGGATQSLSLPVPAPACEQWKTSEDIVRDIDRLIDDHTYAEIADIFNEKGLESGKGGEFNSRKIRLIQQGYKLKSRLTRLRERGMITQDELAEKLGATKRQICDMKRYGVLPLKICNLEKTGKCMYEDPSEEIINMFKNKQIRMYENHKEKRKLSART